MRGIGYGVYTVPRMSCATRNHKFQATDIRFQSEPNNKKKANTDMKGGSRRMDLSPDGYASGKCLWHAWRMGVAHTTYDYLLLHYHTYLHVNAHGST